MKKIFLGIVGKIVLSFTILILIFVINSLVGFFLNSKNQKATLFITSVQQPSVVALNDFQILVLKTQSYVNTWVKTEIEDHPDKKSLPKLLTLTYPELKERLIGLFKQWNDASSMKTLELAFAKYDSVVSKAKIIMEELKTIDDYGDPLKRMENESIRANEVNNLTTELIGIINDLLVRSKELTLDSQQTMVSYFKFINSTSVFLMFFFVASAAIITYLLSQSIIKPVNLLKQILSRLTKGELPEITFKASNDEIGEMVEGSKNFIDVLKKRTAFAVEIGNGNYDNVLEILSEKDVLGKALIQMRDNLKKTALEEKQRNWVTKGIAELGEILRTQNNDIAKLYDSIIKFMVKYTESCLGALFVLHDEGEQYIEMVSCYAYDRKKFIKKRIEIGEGLVGQCVQEGEYIFMNDVPDDYIHIVSGSGEAKPSSILIMPLKYNEIIMGVVELASFDVYENYQIEFVNKAAESIASTISTVKVNERTKKLLEESKMQAEILRAQEEEMRQNTEELIATQEEMARKNKELEELINELKKAKA